MPSCLSGALTGFSLTCTYAPVFLFPSPPLSGGMDFPGCGQQGHPHLLYHAQPLATPRLSVVSIPSVCFPFLFSWAVGLLPQAALDTVISLGQVQGAERHTT